MTTAPLSPARGALRQSDTVVVIGAGIGGLVSALLLAKQGLAVTVVESGDGPGGKLAPVRLDGVDIDTGPTVFTMRWVFDELLAEVDSSLDELVQTEQLEILARHAWAGARPEETLDLFADRERSVQAVGDFAGAAEARRFLGFCAEAERVYRRLETPVLRSGRPQLSGLVRALGVSGLVELARLGPLASLWQTLGRHFRDPRLRQLFARYATYCGASPWSAPATLMLVAQVEMAGVWAVKGGMSRLAHALAGLAARRGVTFRYGQPAEGIELQGGRVAAVCLPDGQRLSADAVVFNGDANALATGGLGAQVQQALAHTLAPLPVVRRSLSAVTWAMRARASGFPLVRHNVFFSDDYAGEFDDILRQRQLPQQGTVYVCAQDRGDDSARVPAVDTDPALERLLCLVNAPADGDTRPFDAMETDACEHRSLALMGRCGLRLEARPAQVHRRTPADWAQRFPATGGALYGRATDSWMTVFQRPGAATAVPGLVLAGGSVHPGPGVPMAALSGRLAAAALMAHLASTRRLHPVAISGGMSTLSATAGSTASS
jgi:1-hydroxycarotenoid 3,4-desaturase